MNDSILIFLYGFSTFPQNHIKKKTQGSSWQLYEWINYKKIDSLSKSWRRNGFG